MERTATLAIVPVATLPSRVHVRASQPSIFQEKHRRHQVTLDLQHVSAESHAEVCFSANSVVLVASQSSLVAASSTPTSSHNISPSSNTQTQTSISGSAVPASSTPTVTPAPKSNSTNLGAAIGAPVVVVSVAFIALLLWFLRYRNRTNAKLKELQEQVVMRESWIEKPKPPPLESHPQELSASEQRLELGEGRSHELPVGLAV